MKEKAINKIKDCSIEFGTGLGLILGVVFMLVFPEFIKLIFTYEQSLFLSAIIILILSSIFCIKGVITRNKLKEEGNWHESS